MTDWDNHSVPEKDPLDHIGIAIRQLSHAINRYERMQSEGWDTEKCREDVKDALYRSQAHTRAAFERLDEREVADDD